MRGPRKPQHEPAALVLAGAVRAHRATGKPREPGDDRKPGAESLRRIRSASTRPVEQIEQKRPQVFLDAGAAVADRYFHGVAARPCHDAEPPFPRRVLRCVADQDSEHLLDALGIAFDAQPLARQVDDELLPAIANQRGVPGRRPLHDRRHVDRIPAQLQGAAVDARQVEQVVDEPREARTIALDDLLRASDARIVSARHALQQLDRAADRRERVAQFMGERREERSLALLENAERRGGFLALGDVETRADIAGKLARAVEARRAVIEYPAIDAVVATQPVFERERFFRIERIRERGLARSEILRMEARRPAVALLLVDRAAGEREPCTVDVDVAARRIGHPQRHRCLVGHDAKTRFALLDRRPRAPRLGRIAEHEHEAAGRPVAAANGVHLRLDGALGTVAGDEHHAGRRVRLSAFERDGGRLARLLVERAENACERLADRFGCRPSGQRRGAVVGKSDIALGVGGDDGIRDRLQRDLEPIALRRKLRARPLEPRLAREHFPRERLRALARRTQRRGDAADAQCGRAIKAELHRIVDVERTKAIARAQVAVPGYRHAEQRRKRRRAEPAIPGGECDRQQQRRIRDLRAKQRVEQRAQPPRRDAREHGDGVTPCGVRQRRPLHWQRNFARRLVAVGIDIGMAEGVQDPRDDERHDGR